MLTLVLGFGSVIDNFYPTALFAVELLTIFLCIRKHGCKLNSKIESYIFIFAFCSVISAVATGTPLLRYASFFIRPIVAVAIINAFKFDLSQIKYYFYKVLRLVAWLAIINFVLALFLAPLFSIMTSSSGYKVHTLGLIFNYIVSTERFGIEFIRNQGLFWEPGVLQIFMNTLVFIELFEYKNKIKKAILPIVVILTTASTTGYILLSFLLIFWYIKRLTNGGGLKKILVSLFSASIVFAILAPLVIEEVVYKSTTGVGSANKRQFDMIMGFKVAIDNPVFGIGPQVEKYMSIENKYDVSVGENVTYEARRNSNIFTMLFAYYGFPMAILFLYSLYKQNIFKTNKIYFIILIIGLFSEPVVFVDLYFVWIMSGAIQTRSKISQLSIA